MAQIKYLPSKVQDNEERLDQNKSETPQRKHQSSQLHVWHLELAVESSGLSQPSQVCPFSSASIDLFLGSAPLHACFLVSSVQCNGLSIPACGKFDSATYFLVSENSWKIGDNLHDHLSLASFMSVRSVSYR